MSNQTLTTPRPTLIPHRESPDPLGLAPLDKLAADGESLTPDAAGSVR